MTKLGERVLTTVDGRTLGVAEWGTPSGVPVLTLHGTPGSRLSRHHDEAMYDRLGMHVVTYDRPGYGLSDRSRGRKVVDAVADVVAIADGLGLDRFVIAGGSGGAPHALACAALLGDRVLSTYAGVPVAPPEPLGDEWMAGQAQSNLDEFAATLAGEDALVEYLNTELDKMRGDALNIFGAGEELTPGDRAVMARDSVQRVMREALVEAVRQGPFGWVDDDIAFLRHPWGFDLTAIRVPVLLAYAQDDTLAPRAHGEYLARVIPGVEVQIMESGHLSAMEYAETNLARVLEMAASRK